jgi:hypothetical protein
MTQGTIQKGDDRFVIWHCCSPNLLMPSGRNEKRWISSHHFDFDTAVGAACTYSSISFDGIGGMTGSTTSQPYLSPIFKKSSQITEAEKARESVFNYYKQTMAQ